MSEFSASAAAIAARMHRDTIEILKPTNTLGLEGGRIKGPPVSLGTHKCNVQPFSSELAQKQYGLEINAVLRIYAIPDDRLQMGRLLKWGGDTYRVTGLPPARSMEVVLAEKVKA
jgi:hypothetical protein